MQSLSISQKCAVLVVVTAAGVAALRWLRPGQKVSSKPADSSSGNLSHQGQSDAMGWQEAAQAARARIKQRGDLPHASVAEQLDILEGLTGFDIGRFMLVNRGWNGFYTHYALTHPWQRRKSGVGLDGKPLSKWERFFLDECPLVRATQERFEHFLRENQKAVVPGARLVCVPSGMLGELLYLDFSKLSPKDQVSLVGSDLDRVTFRDAANLAAEIKLPPQVHVSFQQCDAWKLSQSLGQGQFDLLSSNGLAIYEPDDQKVCALYGEFYKALKPGGVLVTSFFTTEEEWDKSQVDSEALRKQRIMLGDVLGVGFLNLRSESVTREQLAQVGFTDVRLLNDRAHIMPTIVARKPAEPSARPDI
eukprot:g33422.t1